MAKKAVAEAPFGAEDEQSPRGTEVAEVQGVGGVPTLSDDLAEEFKDVMGAGQSENLADRGTPLIYIAQKMSRQIDRQAAEWIEGLQEGMAFNNLTGEMWDAANDGLPFLPCFFRPNWVEWTPREAGGGFRGMHDWVDPREVAEQFEGRPREDRRDVFDLANGNELVLTHHYFGIIPTTMAMAIIPMTSTNLKASQQMQAVISSTRMNHNGRIVTPPAYVLPWKMRTVYSKNDQGSWYRWAPQRLGNIADPNTWTPPELRAICREFALAAARDQVKMSVPLDRGETSDESQVADDQV